MSERPRSPRDQVPRLAAHDRRSLGRLLSEATGCNTARGERAAAKALRWAFARDALGDCAWDDRALTDAGVGRWARPTLLALSPRPALEIVDRAPSSDGATRLLLRATDGALIESVIIPAEAGRDRLRTTLCVSSQVGCARGCSFCHTASLGLERQLGVDEIVDQYRLALRICHDASRPRDQRAQAAASPGPVALEPGRMPRGAELPISNLVFMGMGEPFDNLPSVCRAVALLGDQHAFAFPPTRVTVSTVGVADKLAAFFAATRAELAISLNAIDDERRGTIMPINRRHDLATLRRELVAALPKGRRVLFQYALFDRFNDEPSDADALASYVEGIPCRVNVIPANPGPDPTLTAPSPERVDAFVARLHERGVTTLVRRPRGRDVGGACGQLAGQRRLHLAPAPEPPSP